VNIAIGSDHAGYELKEYVKNILKERDFTCIDVGCGSEASVDYPDFGLKAATLVSEGAAERGILVCGTGAGMSVVANKVKGIRAVLAQDIYIAMQSRRHLDTNVLVLGGRVTGKGLAEEILRVWLETPFEGGRHRLRIDKILEWEEGHLRRA
jgi:ribose 5-phosphate isomerase B